MSNPDILTVLPGATGAVWASGAAGMWEPWQSTATNLAAGCHRLADICQRGAAR
ncbi:MAG: hypothetical protein OXC00_10945 [Acidimicrobiaceae bacterium]|nr:hypothetical protein [Acidimicrobiaceae bacterium]